MIFGAHELEMNRTDGQYTVFRMKYCEILGCISINQKYTVSHGLRYLIASLMMFLWH